MSNLSEVTRVLITDPAVLQAFVESILADSDEYVGLDIESTGLNYPLAQIAGFSLYSRNLKQAAYIPLAHEAGDNCPTPPAVALLQRLADSKIIVIQGGHMDLTFLHRLGVTFSEIRCTLTLSNMLQAQSAGLKEQVLEYGLVNFRDVLSYKALMMIVKGLSVEQIDTLLGRRKIEDVWSFAAINMQEHPRAVTYACDDSIWVRELLDVLEQEHDELVGDATNAALIRQANNDTTVLLAQDSAKGYIISQDELTDFINTYTREVDAEEADLLDQVCTAMGWEGKPPALPSLL